MATGSGSRPLPTVKPLLPPTVNKMHEELLDRLIRARDELAKFGPGSVTFDTYEGRVTHTRQDRLDALDAAIARLKPELDRAA